MNERLLKSDFLESEILKRKFEETASLEDIEWLKDKFNGCMKTVSVSLFPAFFFAQGSCPYISHWQVLTKLPTISSSLFETCHAIVTCVISPIHCLYDENGAALCG